MKRHKLLKFKTMVLVNCIYEGFCKELKAGNYYLAIPTGNSLGEYLINGDFFGAHHFYIV